MTDDNDLAALACRCNHASQQFKQAGMQTGFRLVENISIAGLYAPLIKRIVLRTGRFQRQEEVA